MDLGEEYVRKKVEFTDIAGHPAENDIKLRCLGIVEMLPESLI